MEPDNKDKEITEEQEPFDSPTWKLRQPIEASPFNIKKKKNLDLDLKLINLK